MALEKSQEFVLPTPANDNELGVSMSSVTTPEAVAEKDPFASGRERMSAVGGFFSKKAEQATALAGQAGGAVSRFWERTKKFGGEAAAAVLSAPELLERGADTLVDKATSKGEQFAGFVTNNYERARDFGKNKLEQLKGFAAGKIELAKDVAAYAATKTGEGLNKVREGVRNRFNGLKQYGEDALAYGKTRAGEARDKYYLKVNQVLLWALDQQRKPAVAAESQAAAELAQAQANFNRARSTREGIDVTRDRVARKIELLKGLQGAPA